MIADEQEKRIVSTKLRRAVDGVRVAERRGLFDEGESLGVIPCGDAIRLGIAGTDDHADRLDPRAENFFDDDRERGFRDAVAINERLQRQRALIFASSGDESLAYVHEQAGREKLKAES